jgi:mRNA-degrading endonuclease toxin of MazEF toxin-antitoxin module
MPNTTSFEFGDIVLVSFPFASQMGRKKRPAVVVSSGAYDLHRPDVILMAVTSQVRQTPGFGEVLIKDWRAAGLIKPSVLKPVVFTAEKRIVLKKLGRLNGNDQGAVRKAIETILG